MKSDYRCYLPLLAKSKLVGPCYVTAHEQVVDAALIEAGLTLEAMLSHRPDVSQNLRDHGVITAVFSRAESVYDLEYFRELASKPLANGGLGGTSCLPVTGVSESNLLKLPEDSYYRGANEYGANISVHEFAHTIMNMGLSQTETARIRFRWREALHEGLWKDDWARTNHMEFFAELSQIYFNCQCVKATPFHIGINGPENLESYDPESLMLIDSVYRGHIDLR